MLVIGLALGAVAMATAQTRPMRAPTEKKATTPPNPQSPAEEPASVERRVEREGEPLLEGPIDPQTYLIGPGDVLGLTLQGTIHTFEELPVVAEGTVLIPGAGQVSVAGLSLVEARLTIEKEVARAYRNVEVQVSLLRLRKFLVFVLGQVDRPGQYAASQADRVSEAIVLAGGPLTNASERSIRLIRQDGTQQRCDLLRFWRAGDFDSNPHLRDGDIVLVDFRREGILFNGELYKPGQIEYIEGDSLGGLMELAGGLTQRAKIDTIEVARFQPGSTEPNIFYLFGRTDEERARLRTFAVQRKDAFYIRTDPNWNIRFRVEARGEVLYPGIYIIDEERTTLREVIERAGGFTSDASLREATVVRRVDESLKDAEYERLRLVPPADMSRTEYEYFKMRGRQKLGLMAVDFLELFEKGDQSQDILLKDGDIINVPLKKEYVTLSGQVAIPGNIAYEPGLAAEAYIERAGGYAWKAAKGRTVVIRASTEEWVGKDDIDEIGPGDTIWVPEKPERDWFQIFKEGLLVASQIATVWLVIRTSTQ